MLAPPSARLLSSLFFPQADPSAGHVLPLPLPWGIHGGPGLSCTLRPRGASEKSQWTLWSQRG